MGGPAHFFVFICCVIAGAVVYLGLHNRKDREMKHFWFLRMGGDCLDDALIFKTKTAAINKFQRVAQELASYDQDLEASLHLALNRNTLNEYPEYVLMLGPRGGVQVQAC